jgi:hypothetical protein
MRELTMKEIETVSAGAGGVGLAPWWVIRGLSSPKIV